VYLSLIGFGMTDLLIRDVGRESPDVIFTPGFGPFVPLVALILLAFFGYSLFTLIGSLRKERDFLQRTRIIYLLVGFCIMILGTFSNLIPAFQSIPIDGIANMFNALIIAYVIVKYRLLEIRSIIRISLRYSIPTVVIGTGYFLTIYYGVIVFDLVSGANIFIIALIIALVTAIIFQPLRDRIQKAVDRTFFREKYDSSLMLQRVSENAAFLLNNLDDLSRMIMSELTATLHLKAMGFFIKKADGTGFTLVRHNSKPFPTNISFPLEHPIVQWFSSNQKSLSMSEMKKLAAFHSLTDAQRKTLDNIEAEIFVPIRVRHEVVGFFCLGQKLSGKQFSEEDKLLLGTLANQTAVTIENARLYWEKEQTLRELKESHANLDALVKERTEDLSVINEKLTEMLKEKEILMREIHHRVKNNLQIISSLLKLQTEFETRGSVNDVLNETRNRVRSIALVHEQLYASQNLTKISFSTYIRSITQHLRDTYSAGFHNISIRVESEEIEMDISRAIPCGIIINELVTNSLKYAFAEKTGGTIGIVFRALEAGRFYIEINDDGKGLPVEFNPATAKTFGFQIVSLLAEQLGASINIERKNGTAISITIPQN
jgi:two-component sensor histidine kinase